jgi:transcription initiation factor IIE alpha subunit
MLLIINVLALITIIKILLLFTNNKKEEYTKYVEDSIYDAKWRWKWTKDEIINIECYCPKCDSLLVYDDSSCHTKYTELVKTDFICENCKSQIVTSIHGGNKKYAMNTIKREIQRRIRTEEYKTAIN